MQEILTIKGHRTNERFTKECTDVQVGNTRCEIRKKSFSRIEPKHVADAVERDEAVSVHVNIQECNIKVHEAMARQSILSSRKKRETATVKNKHNDDDDDLVGGGSQVQEVNKAGIRYI